MRAALFLLVTLMSLSGRATAGEMWLTIDHARLYTSEQAVGSILVSNPGIADVTVRSNRELVFFGKMPGSTSLTLFDQSGEKLDTLVLRVQSPRSNRVTLQSGTTRYTFSCLTVCEQINAIGDGTNQSRSEFASVTSQSERSRGVAAAAAAGASNTTRVQTDLTAPVSAPENGS